MYIVLLNEYIKLVHFINLQIWSIIKKINIVITV